MMNSVLLSRRVANLILYSYKAKCHYYIFLGFRDATSLPPPSCICCQLFSKYISSCQSSAAKEPKRLHISTSGDALHLQYCCVNSITTVGVSGLLPPRLHLLVFSSQYIPLLNNPPGHPAFKLMTTQHPTTSQRNYALRSVHTGPPPKPTCAASRRPRSRCRRRQRGDERTTQRSGRRAELSGHAAD